MPSKARPSSLPICPVLRREVRYPRSRDRHSWFHNEYMRTNCRVVHSLHVWKDLKFNWASKHVSRLNINKISNAVKDLTACVFLKKFNAVETLWKPLFSVCTDKSKPATHYMWLVCHIPYAVALSKRVTDTILHIVNHINTQIQILYIII